MTYFGMDMGSAGNEKGMGFLGYCVVMLWSVHGMGWHGLDRAVLCICSYGHGLGCAGHGLGWAWACLGMCWAWTLLDIGCVWAWVGWVWAGLEMV
jgi:hypothetical protein